MHATAGYGAEQDSGLEDREPWHTSRVGGACDSVSQHMRGEAGAMPAFGQHLEQYGHMFTTPGAHGYRNALGQAHSTWANRHRDWNKRSSYRLRCCSLGDSNASWNGARDEAHGERSASRAMNDASVNTSHRRLQTFCSTDQATGPLGGTLFDATVAPAGRQRAVMPPAYQLPIKNGLRPA